MTFAYMPNIAILGVNCTILTSKNRRNLKEGLYFLFSVKMDYLLKAEGLDKTNWKHSLKTIGIHWDGFWMYHILNYLCVVSLYEVRMHIDILISTI